MDQINDAGDTLLKEIGYDGDQQDHVKKEKVLSATQKKQITMRKQLSKSALRALNNATILDYILESMCQAFEMNTT